MRDLLKYLVHSRKSVAYRRGPIDASDRKQVMLSNIIQNGIKITGIAYFWYVKVTFLL